jgi:hypothetical protein
MKNKNLKQLIKEEIKNILKEEDEIEGQATLTPLIKQLGVDPAKFNMTFNLVKQNKTLNSAANKILADVMVALIKSNDDALLQKIFAQLKKIESTPSA